MTLKYDFFGKKKQKKNHNFSVSTILDVEDSILNTFRYSRSRVSIETWYDILRPGCDDQWLWSLVVAFWWFMVVVQLFVIWDCLHKQCGYYEDLWLLSCCFGDRGGDGCVSQDNFHMLPLLIFRYLCKIGLVMVCPPGQFSLIFRYLLIVGSVKCFLYWYS